VNTNRISNERQHNDNMIAVANAGRLSDCRHQLVDVYSGIELQHSDFVIEQIELYRTLSVHLDAIEQTRWIKASIVSDKATSVLRTAVLSGRLPVWRVHNAQEVLLTPLLLDNNNIKYGIFKSYHRPEPDMQGAYLWVKDRDWRKFLASVTPQKDGIAGRPNLTDEAVQLHESRCSTGQAISPLSKEAKAIHSILAELHKDDPNWRLKSDSIAKALRNHAKCQK
jgi:hypothetical protein